MLEAQGPVFAPAYGNCGGNGRWHSIPVIGVNFGASVEGGNMEFVRGQTNAQYFARRGSQLAWALRLRATRTKRLMEGEDVDLGTCLLAVWP